jgi:ABC-type multidrug transport system fused ATPase/permease subunit
MQPDNLRFGGGATETVLHPVVLVAMLIAMALIFLLPRKYVVWPFLCSAFLVPLGQSILAGGLHFFVIRIIILTVALRILGSVFSSRDGAFGNRLGVFDFIFLLWAIFRALAGILVFSFNSGAVIYQAGFLLDAIGGFFVLRYLIRDDEDIYRTLRAFAAISIVIAGCMLFEKAHQVNVFGLLGGVRAAPEIRNGSVRSQGPFEHEILAGSFGATLLPLFFLLWKSGRSRALGILGAIAATVMVLTSASSTPVLAYGAAVIGMCAWPLRRMMRTLRWGIVAALLVLNMIMKAPVWFIIMHIDVVGGSSGYHRAMLVNDFILHFRDWWLMGTAENARWGYNMWDLCNQYVAEGQLGGLATFICFLALICICFSRIGTARKAVEGDRDKEWYFWLLGATLFSHIVAFFGISYFDQTRVSWFALLAIIVAATAPYIIKEPVKRFLRTPLRGPEPKPAYASFSALRSKAAVPLRQHGSQLNTRFS